MATLTNEQIEQKPLNDDELNDVAGGMDVKKPTGRVPGDDPLDPSKPGQKPPKDGIYY
jgi:hypothetical protein